MSTETIKEKPEPKVAGCTCIKDLEERLLKKCQSDEDLGNMRPKGGVIESLWCANRVYRMPDFTKVLNIPFLATWKMPNGKRKETNVCVTASNCPFCGKEFPE